MIRVHAVPARNISSVTEGSNKDRNEGIQIQISNNNMKVGEAVVELDNFKYTLSTYDKPLVEVRDSL